MDSIILNFMRRGFTLIEIIIVVIIVGIMATFAVPPFLVTKERALDSEAKATLALIRSAEKIYKMEHGSWYPLSMAAACMSDMNTALKLSIPARPSSWYYCVSSAGVATAERTDSGAFSRDGRIWTLNAGTACDNPTCIPTTGTCFSPGGCS